MTLTTEQARDLAQRPRMTEAEVEQMISLRADGMSAAEIAKQFPQYAAGTVFNKLSSRKTDPKWSAALEAALEATRRADLEHGTNAAYVAGGVCRQCREHQQKRMGRR